MLGFADDFEKNEGIIVGDKDNNDGSLVAVGGIVGGAIQQSISDDNGGIGGNGYDGDGSGDGTPASSAVDDKLSLDADGDDTDIDKIIDDIDEQFFDSNTTQLIIDSQLLTTQIDTEETEMNTLCSVYPHGTPLIASQLLTPVVEEEDSFLNLAVGRKKMMHFLFSRLV